MSQNKTEAAAARKRRYERVQLDKGLQVAWQGGGKRMVSRARTLGLGGLFIATDNPPEPGTTLKLLFELPGGDVRALATVCSVELGNGMGIQFSGMNAKDRARLDKLLQSLLR